MKTSRFETLKSDIAASIVVFLVAVPLCLGIALASGAPLFAGIIAGIVGGIIVGGISGSQLGVSGPAAGLAVIVLTAIEDLGSYQTFLLAVAISGILQIVFGYLKAGIIAYYFPSSVIKGMLSGIGIIIFLKQLPYAFGISGKAYTAEATTAAGAYLDPLMSLISAIAPGAVIITALSLASMILWEQPWMKEKPISKLIQGPLVVVLGGVVLGQLFQNTRFALTADQLVQVPVASTLKEFFGQFTMPAFSELTNPDVYFVAITIAVVASIETLLSVEAADRLDPHKRVTPTNRELIAQGAGNFVSGMIGGLPVTQVIVRSSVNIQSGGETKLSTILHGFLILICAVAIPMYLNIIPLASLAAILLVVGYKLAKPTLFKVMYDNGLSQFIPFIMTVVGIVFTDLLSGIGLGLVFAVFYILYFNFRTPYRVHQMEDEGGVRQHLRIELARDVTFLHKASVLLALDQIPEHTELTIDGTRSLKIDYDVKEIIEDFKTKAVERDISLHLIGLQDEELPDAKAELVQKVEHIRQTRRLIAVNS